MNHADQLLYQASGLQAWPGHGCISIAPSSMCAELAQTPLPPDTVSGVKRLIAEVTAQQEANMESMLAQQKVALHQLHANLLQRLQQQYESLDLQRESRRQAALGVLVAGVAHQLNTPVGTSLTVASSLEHRLDEFTKLLETGLRRSDVQNFIEDTRLAVDLLMRNLDRAGALVAGYKQIMATKVDSVRSEFRLAELVHETLASMRDIVDGTATCALVDVDDALVLDSYPQSLREVLIHLVDNAIVHGFNGSKHGKIEIRARSDPDGGVSIEVEDSGQGIAAEDLLRVFEPFFTTRMAKGSSGLGLHMVHNRITGLFGGTIHVESTPAQYTRFCIHLPKASF